MVDGSGVGISRVAGARIRSATLEMPTPEPSTMFDHVYREPHSLIAAERSAYLDFLTESS